VSLHAKGVDLFLQSAGARYIDAARPAMFQMLGVFAEFERAMIRERAMAGLSRAKADGIQLGRRRLEATDADKVAAIMAARARGTGIRRIARELGLGVGTVLRVTGRKRQSTSRPHSGTRLSPTIPLSRRSRNDALRPTLTRAMLRQFVYDDQASANFRILR